MIRVEDVRDSLRISNTRLDGEIQATIDAAVLDLAAAGAAGGDIDALTGMAIKLYARWQFDYCGKAEQYHKAYEELKRVLCLTKEYQGGGGDG